MSKFAARLRIIFLIIFTASLSFNRVFAQDVIVTIGIEAGSSSTAVVEGGFNTASPQRELRFLTDYANFSNLDQRISEIRLKDASGNAVAAHQVAPGRFVAETDFTAWAYRADIAPTKTNSYAAHLTWATADKAVILPEDLLPQGHRSAQITLSVPEGWVILGGDRSPEKGVFEVTDIGKSVLYAGRDLRSATVRSAGVDIEVSLSGSWHFADDEAYQMARSIFETYASQFGGVPAQKVYIAIRPFPGQVSQGQWEASSRGPNITIISSDMPFKSQSLQRLHEQLRHEIFHLWIPNGVNLTGNYDWFYEGFALYQSLKIGVAVNRIRFEDMLDTISRAHQISGGQSIKTSLIDASRSRWAGSNTQVYARGILAAFASDLVILGASKGKRSVSDVLRKVFLQYRAAGPRSANQAILDILRSHSELRPIIDPLITGSKPFDWSVLLLSGGLEMYTRDQLATIKVIDRPTGRQKEVLNGLGYNSWRKLPRN